MIKRILPLFLSLVLVFSLATIPAHAAEYSADGCYVDLIEVFGYKGYSGSGNGGILAEFYLADYFKESGLIAFDFEICVVASGAEPVLDHITPDVDFTVSNTVNGFFVRGTFDGRAVDYLSLYFNHFGDCTLSILSFKIYLQRYLFSNFAAVVSSGYNTLPLKPGGSVTITSAPIGDGIFTPVNFSIKVSKTYWADMDYMEFSFTVQCLNIDSISAYSTADNYLPIDINYIGPGYNTDSDLYDGQWFYVSGSVDLSSMDDVNTLGDIQLIVSCVGQSPESALTVTGLRGIHYSGAFNTQALWFNALTYFLIEMDFMIIDTIDLGLQSLTTTISDGFTSLTASIENYFLLLGNYFRDYLFPQLYDTLEGLFSGVTSRLDSLIEALSPDSVDKEVTDGMQQAGSELGGLTDQMQQSSPELNPDNVNVDIGALVDPGGLGSATTLLTVVTGVPFVQQILLIVVSFALIGFVFFGKR